MIRYSVLWSQYAENELAALWCDYPSRPEVTQAADRIDAELRNDAHQKGLALPKGWRSFASSPLIAYFRVDEGDRKVLIEAIRLMEAN